MIYHYDWTRNKRRLINKDNIIDLTFSDEKDPENERPQRDPTFHNGYVIDEDGDKIFIGGTVSIAQKATDEDYDDQIGTKIPEIKAIDPVKDSVLCNSKC
jgi:hypothetical protein